MALVIGNSTYENLSELKNPQTDARLIRDTLEALQFEVIYRENVSKDEMERVISAYGKKLYASGPQTVALFYYAGHGVQSNGENFLLPTDVEVERESDLRFSAVRTSDLLAQMDASGAATKIVILDACRDNPFNTKFGRTKAGAGLAEIGLGSAEFFVAFAATAGNVAEDGEGKNSPYAAALARRLATKDSEISNTFRLVRVDVSAATGQKQLPEARTTLRREFFFTGRPANRPEDQLAASDEPKTLVKAAVPGDLYGKWCTASRGSGVSFSISPKELLYSLGGQTSRYPVQSIVAAPEGNLQMTWQSASGGVVFEFGQFNAAGSMMTQIRGRQSGGGEWKDYGLRLRKCG